MRAEAIRYIVLHCSATRSDRPYPPEALERDHRARGFHGAGYHFYIRQSGTIIPLRPLHQIGAHVRGYNRWSWGVCYEGGLDPNGKATDTRTEAQKVALRQLLVQLKALAPQAEIVGHRDLSPDRNGDGHIDSSEWIKLCPCFDARTEYKHLTSPHTPHGK